MGRATSAGAVATGSPTAPTTSRSSTSSAPVGVEAQPVSNITWVDPSTLRGNMYNPNSVAPPEMALLRLSLLESGWTQPIVTRTPESDGTAEIVDGFHRWMLGSTDPDIRAMTGGLVPVCRLPATLDPATQRMATVRHNRARGTHAVVRMADIVIALRDLGETDADIGRRLGMEPDEVRRLAERGNMAARGRSVTEWSRGWKPAPAGAKGAR